MQRRTLEEQKHDLERKRAQIEARLKAISAREVSATRKTDTRRKVIVGALALGAADASPQHRRWVLGLLQNAPRRAADAAILDGLIADLERQAPQEPAISEGENDEAH